MRESFAADDKKPALFANGLLREDRWMRGIPTERMAEAGRKKYEYHTQLIDTKDHFGSVIETDEFNRILNERGREGWELVGLTASNQVHGSIRWVVCIFKRELN